MVKLMKKIKIELMKDQLGYQKNKLLVLLISLPIPFVIAILAYLLGAQSTIIIAVAALGLIIVTLPYLGFRFLEFRDIKEAEDGYPNFLRDLAQSISAGMTFPQAIKLSSETKYAGLTKYVKRLNIWLSWDLPFPDAWNKFTNLLKNSVLIRRINSIIIESFHSGSNIGITLNVLASDVTLLKQMEADRKSMTQQQIIIMYIVFFIFAGVLVGLYKILSPVLFIQKLGLFSGLNLSVGGEQMDLNYFKNLFFLMLLIEGACAGFIAGQISEDNLIAGFKHVVIMLSSAVIIYFIFIFPTELGLEASIYPNTVNAEDNINIVGRVFYESSPAIGAEVSILTPEKTIISTTVDSAGEFRETIVAPIQPGAYAISISTEYKGSREVITKSFKVR